MGNGCWTKEKDNLLYFLYEGEESVIISLSGLIIYKAIMNGEPIEHIVENYNISKEEICLFLLQEIDEKRCVINGEIII